MTGNTPSSQLTEVHGCAYHNLPAAVGPPHRRTFTPPPTCDLCGYNLQRFDLPMLLAEYTRAGRDLCLNGRAIIDPLAIFHEREKRSLGDAVRFYLDRDHDGAHAAEADVIATVAVLDAMLERYDDLPRDVATLHELLRDPDEVDVSGKFRRVNGEICFRFGSHKGKSLQAVLVEAPDYLQWILASDFPDDTKAVVRTAIQASVTASSGSDFDGQGPLS